MATRQHVRFNHGVNARRDASPLRLSQGWCPQPSAYASGHTPPLIAHARRLLQSRRTPAGRTGSDCGGNGLWTSDRPWNADNEAAAAEWGRSLAADVHSGRWRPAIGNSDAHLEGQIGIPHTVVLAEELSTDAVLAGIRAGRSWIAGSAAVALSFDICAGGRSAGVGERLETGGEPAVVRVDVQGVPSGSLSYHTD